MVQVQRYISLVLLIFKCSVIVDSLNDEGLALLFFKQAITENSSADLLDNWNSSDTTPCSWRGVECSAEKQVVSLRLPSNGLGGYLHLDGGKLPALRNVNLRNNHFYGSLPAELFNATGLKSLVLSGNSFSGQIPPEIGNLKSMQSLDLSENSFNGSIPSSLAQCNKLKKLFLGGNKFSGTLPDGILGNNLVMLQGLNLSFNNLSGPIPRDLGNLSRLQGVLDLSHNCLNGSIPESLGDLSELVYINLSYNNLSGPIPQNGGLMNAGPPAFTGNPLLCGFPSKNQCPEPLPSQPGLTTDFSPVRRRKSGNWRPWIIVIAAVTAGVFIAGLLFSFWSKKIRVCKGSEKRVQGSDKFEEKPGIRKDMFCFRTDDLESLSEHMEQYTFVRVDSRVGFDLEQLLKASAYLLGKSGIGIIYKVVLEKGPTVAVRRLEDGSCQRFREFQNEVEAIGKIRHPNIVSLLAYCWCGSEKLLIYEYVPNGDLATAIHGRIGPVYFKPIPWSIRLRIVIGLARGLAFLHEFSFKKYVHGNLKPRNVLLGENMEPRISDFGLNRLAYTNTSEESIAVPQLEQMSTGSTPQQCSPHSVTVTPTNSRMVGTFYEAPEASKFAKPSQKWDVYSFGMILLEIVSGKSPAMQITAMETDLVRWIQVGVEVKPLSDILDPFLARDLNKEKECEMVSVLKIGLACVQISPDKRPSMRNVCDALEKLASASTSTRV